MPGRAELERIARSSSGSPPAPSESDSPTFSCASGLWAVRTGGSTGARRNHALKARSNRSSSSWRETSVWRSAK